MICDMNNGSLTWMLVPGIIAINEVIAYEYDINLTKTKHGELEDTFLHEVYCMLLDISYCTSRITF